jgi:hypothetical protein
MKMDGYLAIVAAGLAVIVLGCWNPKALQAKDSSNSDSGYPNYLWLALGAVLVGGFVCWSQCSRGYY